MAERLQDAPRPGAPPKITTEQRCQIAALACEAPSKAGRPISQWTGREIADELKSRGIVAEISPRHATYLREVWGLQPHRFRYWLTEVPDERREEKIVEGCQVYAQAAERAKQGERSISLDITSLGNRKAERTVWKTVCCFIQIAINKFIAKG